METQPMNQSPTQGHVSDSRRSFLRKGLAVGTADVTRVSQPGRAAAAPCPTLPARTSGRKVPESGFDIEHERPRPQHIVADQPEEVAHVGHKQPHELFRLGRHQEPRRCHRRDAAHVGPVCGSVLERHDNAGGA